MTGARPSPARSPGGWRRLPAGSGGVPAMNPVLFPSPPSITAFLVRDIHIQFAIEVLRRVGVKPRGSNVSGCRMVSEALGLGEDTVRRIWKECPVENVLRARDAEILEGHRRTHWAVHTP